MRIISAIKNMFTSNYKRALKNGLNVGKGVRIIGGVHFGSEPYLITLEDEVAISSNVTFITHDGGTWAFRDLPKYKDVIKYGKIHIGKRTLVGHNSIIMPGVKIGERCVIGTGSIVTKDIPDGSVVVGAPARVVMTTEEYAEKCLNNMKPYDKEKYLSNKKEYLLNWLDD